MGSIVSHLQKLIISKKRLLVFFFDLFLIASAYTLAFSFRFEFSLPLEYREIYFRGLWFVICIKPIVFYVSGLYRKIWSYVSLQDALEILKVVTISSVIVAFSFMHLRSADGFPRSIYLLDWLLLVFLVSSSRLTWRLYREKGFNLGCLSLENQLSRRALIVGAGEAGSLLLKEIRRQEKTELFIVGFVDDSIEKQGMYLQQVPVLGNIRQLNSLVHKYRIEEVIVAIPSAQGKTLKRIISNCEMSDVTVKTLPRISDIIDGKVSVSQIKNVDIEDLLGRDPVVLDEKGISSNLKGRRVLVTGAAGSIGSEICRQVARFAPSSLMILDSAETPLFFAEKKLTSAFPDLTIVPVIADIRDRRRIMSLFESYAPEVVFHAAAYKHVPMMEENPLEAVTNNIFGTRTVVEAADRTKVETFVMISTDKAVNPVNIMGASKRAAEIYVQAMALKSRTKYVTVRFGNVLGSNGSVIPIFKEQIARGGPVTVTDREVIRYFMTIPEASQLVLQAGFIGRGGEILLLDMGSPVKIIDLAEQLIRLSGFVPYEDIDIVFTGLRPGEKLFEELLMEGEGIKPTSHSKIKISGSVPTDLVMVSKVFDLMHEHVVNVDTESVLRELCALVPEFRHGSAPSAVRDQSVQRGRPGIVTPAAEHGRKVLPIKR